MLEYDEFARQSPWTLESEGEGQATRRARAKAAEITGLLDLSSLYERDVALRCLTELFEYLHYPVTFRAIQNVALEGLDFETLQAMIMLRYVWMERPDLWVGRYGWQREVSPLRQGASAFSWALARRVCLTRWNHHPETMIDDEWLDEWLRLPPGAPGYLSFPAYIDVKVDTPNAELLDDGLRLEARGNGYADLGDDFAWYRRVPDREQAIRDGFRIVTPYDDRPGRLGDARHKWTYSSDD